MQLLEAFCKYFCEKWPEVIFQTSLTVLAVIISLIAAYCIFHKETSRHFENERIVFKGSLAALLQEAGENYGLVNRYLRDFEKKEFDVFNMSILSHRIIDDILANPLFYNYTGDELMYAVASARRQIITTNSSLTRALELLKEKKFTDKHIERLTQSLVEAKGRVLMMQVPLQQYIIANKVKFPVSLSNKDEVMSWLRGGSITIEDLEKRLEELKSLPEEAREDIHRTYLEKLRESLPYYD